MKFLTTICAMSLILSACGNPETQTSKEHDMATHQDEGEYKTSPLANLTREQIEVMNTTPTTSAQYPSPPAPHYGPEYGSITFTDTDRGPTIGGTLTMKPAVDDNGKRLNEANAGITMYMIHWGLEVGDIGTQDDKGAGDLGGDCMGFRDTGHVVMMSAEEAQGKDILSWTLPQGTKIPEKAVYFVGHTLYGKIHNLEKCTQTKIVNIVK